MEKKQVLKPEQLCIGLPVEVRNLVCQDCQMSQRGGRNRLTDSCGN